MDKKSVYIVTSIISYQTARPSRDLLAAAWQKITIDWWDTQRDRFDLYTSDLVVEEAGRGGDSTVSRRLEALAGIPSLDTTDEVVALSEAHIDAKALPQKAVGDSLHIALSAVHGLDHLLTWNHRHIDNAETKPIIRTVCLAKGYAYPEICTPQGLMGYMKMADEIITELWEVKDAIAKEHGCDVKALVAHLRTKKREEDNRVIDPRAMKQAAEQKNAADGESAGA